MVVHRQSKRQFICQQCAYELNADYNATRILRANSESAPPEANVSRQKRTLSVCVDLRDAESERRIHCLRRFNGRSGVH